MACPGCVPSKFTLFSALFSSNYIPNSVNGTVELRLYRSLDGRLSGGRRQKWGRRDTQPYVGFGAPAFEWKQHFGVYAGPNRIGSKGGKTLQKMDHSVTDVRNLAALYKHKDKPKASPREDY